MTRSSAPIPRCCEVCGYISENNLDLFKIPSLLFLDNQERHLCASCLDQRAESWDTFKSFLDKNSLKELGQRILDIVTVFYKGQYLALKEAAELLLIPLKDDDIESHNLNGILLRQKAIIEVTFTPIERKRSVNQILKRKLATWINQVGNQWNFVLSRLSTLMVPPKRSWKSTPLGVTRY